MDVGRGRPQNVHGRDGAHQDISPLAPTMVRLLSGWELPCRDVFYPQRKWSWPQHGLGLGNEGLRFYCHFGFFVLLGLSFDCHVQYVTAGQRKNKKTLCERFALFLNFQASLYTEP